MPIEQGYTRQTRPQAGAPLSGVSAEGYGAGLGRQIAQTAENLHRENLRGYAIERERTRDEEWSKFSKEFATARDDMGRIVREFRNRDEPGHAQRVSDLYQQRRERLLGGITEDAVRQRAEAAFDEYGERLHGNEADYEELQRSGRVVRDQAATQAIAANRIRRLENADDYAAELQLGHDAIDGLNLRPDLKQKLHDDWDQAGGVSFLRGTIDRDPQLAHAMLTSGEGLFDNLDPNTVNALLNNADVEIRSRAVEAARIEQQQAQATREQVQTLIERNKNGEVIPDEDFAQAQAAVTALGDTSLAEQLEGTREHNRVTRVWGPANATAVQRQQRIAALARIEPEKRTAAQSRELQALTELSPGWDKAEASDPTGTAMLHGGPGAPPPIDLTAPAPWYSSDSWAKRVRWASSRGMPAFTATEAAALQQDYAREGGESRMFAALDTIPGGYDRALAAEQIAPGPTGATFRHLAQLQPQVRAVTRRGEQAIASNPNFFKTQSAEAETRLSDIDEQLARALRGVNASFLDAAKTTMRQYVAGNVAVNGGTDAELLGNDGGDQMLQVAARVALGGERRNGRWLGGLGSWGGRAFVIPEDMDQAEFAAAAVQDIRRQKDNPPVNPDNSPASLSRMYPVWLGGNRYGWESATGATVLAKDGLPFISRIGR